MERLNNGLMPVRNGIRSDVLFEPQSDSVCLRIHI
jgi:hypothetical protein